jgi:hypothetical protein
VVVEGPRAAEVARAVVESRGGVPVVVGLGPGDEAAARALARAGRPVADSPPAGLVVDGWAVVRTGPDVSTGGETGAGRWRPVWRPV